MKTKKLTKVQRRIGVLKDVLLQIEQKKYIPERFSYMNLPNSLTNSIKNDVTMWEQAQPYLLKQNKPCEACAKGALFLSIVRKENGVRLGNLLNTGTRTETHDELFGESNMDLVESVFEGWYDYDTPLDKKKKKFYNKYPDNDKRLAAIVKNMIANKGKLRL